MEVKHTANSPGCWYEVMKQLMLQHFPSLNPATTSSAYSVNPKPEDTIETDIHSVNAWYVLWLQIEHKHGQTYAHTLLHWPTR